MPSILIIDDDQAIIKLLTHYFSSKGWAAAGAQRGEQGRELADKFSPDIILLDVKLPDMDGIEVLKKLKAQGSTAAIVIMTGGGSIPNAVEAIKLGAEQYLTKPLVFAELDRLIDRIIETRKLRIENLYYRHRMDHPISGTSMEVQTLHHLIDLMAENGD